MRDCARPGLRKCFSARLDIAEAQPVDVFYKIDFKTADLKLAVSAAPTESSGAEPGGVNAGRATERPWMQKL